MHISSIHTIAQALAIAPLGRLTQAQLVRQTGLAKQTITNACQQLNLIRHDTRPATYSVPVGGLRELATAADDLVPRPWHLPVPGDPEHRLPELTSLQLYDKIRENCAALAAWDLNSSDHFTLEETLRALPLVAGRMLELTARLAAVASRPDWYEALGGNVGVASFEDVDTTELP